MARRPMLTSFVVPSFLFLKFQVDDDKELLIKSEAVLKSLEKEKLSQPKHSSTPNAKKEILDSSPAADTPTSTSTTSPPRSSPVKICSSNEAAALEERPKMSLLTVRRMSDDEFSEADSMTRYHILSYF
jgi:hypothetical protein